MGDGISIVIIALDGNIANNANIVPQDLICQHIALQEAAVAVERCFDGNGPINESAAVQIALFLDYRVVKRHIIIRLFLGYLF